MFSEERSNRLITYINDKTNNQIVIRKRDYYFRLLEVLNYATCFQKVKSSIFTIFEQKGFKDFQESMYKIINTRDIIREDNKLSRNKFTTWIHPCLMTWLALNHSDDFKAVLLIILSARLV